MTRSDPIAPQTPFTIDCIDHILLIVSGMSDALAFYEGVLGCFVESHLPQYGMVELKAGSSHIDLVDVAAPEGAWAKPTAAPSRNVDHIALKLSRSNENVLRNYLMERGIAIFEERTEDDGNVSFYVRDPSGNRIELIAVKAPAA